MKEIEIIIDGDEHLHKCIQSFLFSKGIGWVYGGKVLKDFGINNIAVSLVSSKLVMSQNLIPDVNIVKATDILSGRFDLDKWISSILKKETPKNGVVVDLTWIKGEANKVLNAKIQSIWLSSGYKWVDGDTDIYDFELNYIYLYVGGIAFLSSMDDYKFTTAFEEGYKLVEISPNEALKGGHKKYL